MAQPNHTDEIPDLTEILKLVKSDTKFLIKDLFDGVNQWYQAATLAFTIGTISLLLGSTVVAQGTGILNDMQIAASYGMAILAFAASYSYWRKYLRLKKKYRALFEAAKKL